MRQKHLNLNNKTNHLSVTRDMLRCWGLPFCCTTEASVSMQLEITRQHQGYGAASSTALDRKPKDIKEHLPNIQPDVLLDSISEHWLSIFIDLSAGEVLKDQDFIYITYPLQQLPQLINELDSERM